MTDDAAWARAGRGLGDDPRPGHVAADTAPAEAVENFPTPGVEAELHEPAVLVERLIARLDMLDSDVDLEADVDDEDTHDAEAEPIELDLAYDERSHNTPVSETTLGEAALLPQPMPPAASERREATVVLPEAPPGYVAIRVLPIRLVER